MERDRRVSRKRESVEKQLKATCWRVCIVLDLGDQSRLAKYVVKDTLW